MSTLCKVALALDGEKSSFIKFGNMKFVRVYELSDGEDSGSEQDSETGQDSGSEQKLQAPEARILSVTDREIPDINSFQKKDEFACHGKNDEFLNALGNLLSDCKYLIVGESGGYPSRVLLRYGISVLEQQGDIEILLDKILSFEKKDKKV